MNRVYYVSTGTYETGLHLFRIEGVTSEYIGTYFLVKHLDDEVPEGEKVVWLGPSLKLGGAQ